MQQRILFIIMEEDGEYRPRTKTLELRILRAEIVLIVTKVKEDSKN